MLQQALLFEGVGATDGRLCNRHRKMASLQLENRLVGINAQIPFGKIVGNNDFWKWAYQNVDVLCKKHYTGFLKETFPFWKTSTIM